MGFGYLYSCSKCRKRYSVHAGIGMMFPDVYKELIQEFKDGKHGEEARGLLRDIKYAAVDAEEVVYVCKACGYWEMGHDDSIYAPNDPNAIARKRYGIKTVKEWGYVPYVMKMDLVDDYHILKRYFHKCCKCGKRMHKASDKEMQHLPCPKCGAQNDFKDAMLWD